MLGAIQSFFSIFLIPVLALFWHCSTAPAADTYLPWCNSSITSFLLLFPRHEATLRVAICSLQTFCFYLWVWFLACSGFPTNVLRGREAPVGRSGMQGGRWAVGRAGLQWSSQTCCWEPFIPPGGSGLLGTAETVPAFNTQPQLCFKSISWATSTAQTVMKQLSNH